MIRRPSSFPEVTQKLDGPEVTVIVSAMVKARIPRLDGPSTQRLPSGESRP